MMSHQYFDLFTSSELDLESMSL